MHAECKLDGIVRPNFTGGVYIIVWFRFGLRTVVIFGDLSCGGTAGFAGDI
jgi:hypothetical protein